MYCTICEKTTHGDRTVTPCANVDCRNDICNLCQATNPVMAALGVCDEEACAVEAIRDLRIMLRNSARKQAA